MAATFSRTTRFLERDRPGRRLVGVLLVLLLAAWGAWFVLARVTVHEVTAKARLEVQSAAHTVATPVGGKVVETWLIVGNEVKAGEVLVVLDASVERRALQHKQTCHEALVKRISALREEIDAEQMAVGVQQAARGIAFDEANAAVQEASIRATSAKGTADFESRNGAKGITTIEDARKFRAEAEAAKATVTKLTLAASRLKQEGLVQESDRMVRLAKVRSELVALEGEAAGERAAIAMLEQNIELRVIRAPVAGRIGEAAAEVQVGSVVRVADKLAAIIPPGSPRAVALFPASAIGRIRPGQTARLRLDGFPWTQYGTLAATVTSVANEGSGGQIRVELALAADPSSLIPLGHGLPGTAEVEVEEVSPVALVLRGAGVSLMAARQ